MKHLSCGCACMCPVINFLHKPLCLIYEDILTKFAENDCGYENISVKSFGLVVTIVK